MPPRPSRHPLTPTNVALGTITAAIVLVVYTYVGYPALLWLLGRRRPLAFPRDLPDDRCPSVSISVPVYNEERQIGDLIESLLAVDYPRDRLQIVIVSDASTDRTDAIVRAYADRGVELLRLDARGGKTRAEAAAASALTGEVIVNTDATIRIPPDAIRRLVAAFEDPTIGCASGRDVSVSPGEVSANVVEGGYVGYEMAVRELETKVAGIVGASGCFYAIRSHLHRLPLPGGLSRDFAAALRARQYGFRAVSVRDAVCYVPRSQSVRKEYRRKVRTIARGMRTLWHVRSQMNPFRYGTHAWMLVSHKICRWLLPWAALAALLALFLLAPRSGVAMALVVAVIVGGALALVGWLMDRGDAPAVFTLPAFLAVGNLAAAHALVRALRGADDAIWEPTRRGRIAAP